MRSDQKDPIMSQYCYDSAFKLQSDLNFIVAGFRSGQIYGYESAIIEILNR